MDLVDWMKSFGFNDRSEEHNSSRPELPQELQIILKYQNDFQFFLDNNVNRNDIQGGVNVLFAKSKIWV